MNQGRIWCVVHPTVGLPLFLGSVTLISLTVHGAVLSNTTWMSDFYQGNRSVTTAMIDSAPKLASATAPAGDRVTATPVATKATSKAIATTANKVVATAAPAGASPAG